MLARNEGCPYHPQVSLSDVCHLFEAHWGEWIGLRGILNRKPVLPWKKGISCNCSFKPINKWDDTPVYDILKLRRWRWLNMGFWSIQYIGVYIYIIIYIKFHLSPSSVWFYLIMISPLYSHCTLAPLFSGTKMSGVLDPQGLWFSPNFEWENPHFGISNPRFS